MGVTLDVHTCKLEQGANPFPEAIDLVAPFPKHALIAHNHSSIESFILSQNVWPRLEHIPAFSFAAIRSSMQHCSSMAWHCRRCGIWCHHRRYTPISSCLSCSLMKDFMFLLPLCKSGHLVIQLLPGANFIALLKQTICLSTKIARFFHTCYWPKFHAIYIAYD